MAEILELSRAVLRFGMVWLSSFATAGVLLAQPSLRITSPADGTVVHPGESVKVRVEVSGKFQLVFVIAGDPIGMATPLRSAPPYEFTLYVPTDVAPKSFGLSADGVIEPGHNANSPVVWIHTEEPNGAPLKFSVDHPELELRVGNGRSVLTAEGTFPDGRTVVLSHSRYTAFRSSDARVAEVSPDGVVTPLAAGSAKITVTYRDSSVVVPVTVLPKAQ